METVQQNGRFTLISIKFHSMYSLFSLLIGRLHVLIHVSMFNKVCMKTKLFVQSKSKNSPVVLKHFVQIGQGASEL